MIEMAYAALAALTVAALGSIAALAWAVRTDENTARALRVIRRFR